MEVVQLLLTGVLAAPGTPGRGWGGGWRLGQQETVVEKGMETSIGQYAPGFLPGEPP